mmetsp:Transcript_27805/g.73442  ORF Transcript_27805/g.73442 Transcript_27805/m.73442 type:complete len:751 (-) Transcript_27805:356-2608(-)
MDKDQKLMMLLESLGEQYDPNAAEEILVACDWNVEAALELLTGVDGDGPGYAHTATQGVDAEGYRAPMRTGYQDQLIGGPDLDELAYAQAAARRQRSSGHHRRSGSRQGHRDVMGNRGGHGRNEEEQAGVAEALHASYAMHTRQANNFDAERDLREEQDELARAIEASYREQTGTDATYRQAMAEATAVSLGRDVGSCPEVLVGQLRNNGVSPTAQPRVSSSMRESRDVANADSGQSASRGGAGTSDRFPPTRGGTTGSLRGRGDGVPPGGRTNVETRVEKSREARRAEEELLTAPPRPGRLPARQVVAVAPGTLPRPVLPGSERTTNGFGSGGTRPRQPKPTRPLNPQAGTGAGQRTPPGRTSAAEADFLGRPTGVSTRSREPPSFAGSDGAAPGSMGAPTQGRSAPGGVPSRSSRDPYHTSCSGVSDGVAPSNRMGVASSQYPPASAPGQDAVSKEAFEADRRREARRRESEKRDAEKREMERRAEERLQVERERQAEKREVERQREEREREEREREESSRRTEVAMEERRRREALAETERRRRETEVAAERTRQAAQAEGKVTEAEAQSTKAETQERQRVASELSQRAADATKQRQAEDWRRRELAEQDALRREAFEAEERKREAERTLAPEEKKEDDVVTALLALRKKYRETDPKGLATCLQTLRTYINNLARNPHEPKFQRINCDNNAFRQRVAGFEGAIGVLLACGFEEDGSALAVPQVFIKSKGPKLFDALAKVDVMLNQLSG